MKIKRRQFIKNCVATSVLGGFTLSSSYLFGQSTTLEAPYLLIINAEGGWDTTAVFDNKSNSSAIDTQQGNTAATGAGEIPYVSHSDRPAVDTFFNAEGENSLIINGIYTQAMDHKKAVETTMSTVPPSAKRPVDFGTFYAAQIGLGKYIPHHVIEAPYLPGNFRNISYFCTDSQFDTHGAAVLGSSEQMTSAETDALHTFLQAKYTEMITNNINSTIDSEKIQAFIESFKKESSFTTFLNSYTPDTSGSKLLKHGKTALNLFKNGFSQVVSISAGGKGAWDSHSNNDQTQSQNFESLFSDLSAIVAEARSLGIENQLTIIVQSEMGRSPKKNSDGGKDHWPFTSMLLWGVGINGGQTLGQTTDFQIGLPVNPLFGTYNGDGSIPLTPSHIYAALYNIFGIPYTIILPDIIPASIILKAGS